MSSTKMDAFAAYAMNTSESSAYSIQSGLDEEAVDVDVPLMVFRILVCTIGTIGNLLVIFVILVLREYEKAVTHWYVLQLAVADTLFLLTLPFKIVEDLNNEWIFTDAACRMKETILFLNYYSSILFLVTMSIDRYIAVCHGLVAGLQKLRTKRAAYVIAGLIWITAFLLCIPVLTYSSKMGTDPYCKCQYEFPNPAQSAEELCRNVYFSEEAEYLACVEQEKQYENVERCVVADYDSLEELFGDYGSAFTGFSPGELIGCTYAESGPGWKAFISFNFVVMFAIPFIIMSACYVMIILRLKKTRLRSNSITGDTVVSTTTGSFNGSRKRRRSKSAASMKAESNRNRVTVMCGALVLLFLACWLPFHTIHLAKMNGIHGSTDYCLKLASIASLIGYVNSALNPYLYNFIGTKFGKRLRSATGSVQRSVKKRTSSLSNSGVTVRYHSRKQNDAGTSSTGNTGTVITKIHHGKCETGNHPESSCANEVFEEESKLTHEQEPLVQRDVCA